ncbi:MAG TPA: discoidin domain-containing protein [Armatimonadota bacterium]|jgi:hypothetical protein
MKNSWIAGLALGAVALATALAPVRAASVTTVAGSVNIAAAANGGRIVAFSSELLDENKKPIPEWQVSNLIDGKYVVGNYTPADSYGWASASPPSEEKPEWVIIGFTDPANGKDVTHLISRVVIDPTTDDPPIIGRWSQGVTVQTSTTDKNGPWTTVGRFLVVNRPVKQTFDFPPTEARYIRLLITSNHGSDRSTEMGEVEAYEAIIPGEQLDELIVRMENVLNDLKRYRDGKLYKLQQDTGAAVTQKPAPADQPGGAHPLTPTTPAAPGAVVTPPAPVTPPPPPVTRVSAGAVSLALLPGWTQAPDGGDVEDNVKLMLTGPAAGGEPMVLTVAVELVAAKTTLDSFTALVTERWPGATIVPSAPGKLAGAESRYLVLTADGKVYFSYCLLSGTQGITLTAVAPAAAREEAAKLLQPLWDSVKVAPAG